MKRLFKCFVYIYYKGFSCSTGSASNIHLRLCKWNPVIHFFSSGLEWAITVNGKYVGVKLLSRIEFVLVFFKG